MSNVIHRTTTPIDYRKRMNTPDFPSGTWLINPDLSALSSVAQKYWKVVSETVVEMTQTEKDAVDASDDATTTSNLKAEIKSLIYPSIEPPISSIISTSGLVITVDIDDLITNDQTTMTADSSDVKHVLTSIIHNSATDVFSILVREYTTGAYASLGTDETLVEDLKEYTIAVDGTVLTEV